MDHTGCTSPADRLETTLKVDGRVAGGGWCGTPDGNLHVRDRLRRCAESSDFRKDQGVRREEAETMAARYGNCSAGDHTHALSSSWERRGRGKRGGSSTTPPATSGRKRAPQWLARQAPCWTGTEKRTPASAGAYGLPIVEVLEFSLRESWRFWIVQRGNGGTALTALDGKTGPRSSKHHNYYTGKPEEYQER